MSDVTVPDEPPPDAYEWTSEPEDPDAGGMPGEYVNDAGDGVPGVRREADPPDSAAGGSGLSTDG